MCHIYLLLGCRCAHDSLVQSNTLMSFLSSSGSSSQRTRVRVCIPQSVQTHKTLTGSLRGALREALRASGGNWPPKLHNQVKEQRLVFQGMVEIVGSIKEQVFGKEKVKCGGWVGRQVMTMSLTQRFPHPSKTQTTCCSLSNSGKIPYKNIQQFLELCVCKKK